MRPFRWLVGALGLVVAGAAASCDSTTTVARAAGLELLIGTNIATVDITKVTISVSELSADGGAPVTLPVVSIDPVKANTLPTTVSITPGTHPDQLVNVRAVAWGGAIPLVLRDIEVAVPTDRVAALDVFLAAACSDARFLLPGPDGGPVDSLCALGTTCQPGDGSVACLPDGVDAASLPTYVAGEELDAGPVVTLLPKDAAADAPAPPPPLKDAAADAPVVIGSDAAMPLDAAVESDGATADAARDGGVDAAADGGAGVRDGGAG